MPIESTTAPSPFAPRDLGDADRKGGQIAQAHNRSFLGFIKWKDTDAIAGELTRDLFSGRPSEVGRTEVSAAMAQLDSGDQAKVLKRIGELSVISKLSSSKASSWTSGILQDIGNKPPQAELGARIAAQLSRLQPADRALVANRVVSALSDAQLDAIGTQGIEALRSVASADNAGRLDREMTRRNPSQVNVNGVTIVAEEVSEDTLRQAAEQVARLTENPEVAQAMAGQIVELVPKDERLTDQEVAGYIGLKGKTPDGREIAELPGNTAGGLIDVDERNITGSSKDLYNGQDLAQFRVLDHEFTHGIHFKLLSKLSPQDPHLLALLAPKTKLTGTETADDIIKLAYEQRKNSPKPYFNPAATTDEREWIAQAGEGFNSQPGDGTGLSPDQLAKDDPALYDLLQQLYPAGGVTNQESSPQLPDAWKMSRLANSY